MIEHNPHQFIFRNPEGGDKAPDVSEKVEKVEKQESPDQLAKDAEKVQSEKEKAEKKLKKLREKLAAAKELALKLNLKDKHAQASSLLNQAEALLKAADEDLKASPYKATEDMAEDSVEEVTDTVEDFKTYSAKLMKSYPGLVEEQTAELYRLTESSPTAIKFLNSIKKTGIDVYIVLEAILYGREPISYHQQTIDLLNSTGLRGHHLVDALEDAESGMGDDTVLYISKATALRLADFAKRMKKLHMPDEFIARVFSSFPKSITIAERVEKLWAAGIKDPEVIINVLYSYGKKIELFIEQIGLIGPTLKAAGFTEQEVLLVASRTPPSQSTPAHLQLIIELHRLSELPLSDILKNNMHAADASKVVVLLNLRPQGVELFDIFKLAALPDDAQTIYRFFSEALRGGLQMHQPYIDSASKWFTVEKDPQKVIAYRAMLKKLEQIGLYAGAPIDLYRICPRPDFILKHQDAIKSLFEEKELSVSAAIHVLQLNEQRSENPDDLGPFNAFESAILAKHEHTNQKEIIMLWTLTTDSNEALRLIATNRQNIQEHGLADTIIKITQLKKRHPDLSNDVVARLIYRFDSDRLIDRLYDVDQKYQLFLINGSYEDLEKLHKIADLEDYAERFKIVKHLHPNFMSLTTQEINHLSRSGQHEIAEHILLHQQDISVPLALEIEAKLISKGLNINDITLLNYDQILGLLAENAQDKMAAFKEKLSEHSFSPEDTELLAQASLAIGEEKVLSFAMAFSTDYPNVTASEIVWLLNKADDLNTAKDIYFLKSEGMDLNAINFILSLGKDQLQSGADYFFHFHQYDFPFTTARAWYAVEKNYEKAVNFLTSMEELKFMTPLIAIYQVEPSERFLLYQYDRMQELMTKYDLSEIQAIGVLQGFRDELISKQGADLSPEQQLEFGERGAYDLSEFDHYVQDLTSQFGEQPSHSYALLWRLTRNQDEAKTMFQNADKNGFKEMASYRDQAFTIISTLNGESNETILQIGKVLSDPRIIKTIIDFEKKYRTGLINSKPDDIKKLVIISEKCAGRPDLYALYRHIAATTNEMRLWNVEIFFQDASLPLAAKVYKLTNNAEMALRIGRTLYFSGMTPDQADTITIDLVSRTQAELAEKTAEYKDVKVLEGRNVVMLYNNEYWNERTRTGVRNAARFFDDEMKEDIEASIGTGGSLQLFAPKKGTPTEEDLKRVKAATIDAIINTPPPMTFIFNGHGGPDGLYFNNGQVEGEDGKLVSSSASERLSSYELSEALEKRAEKFKGREDELRKDILALNACFTHTYAKKVVRQNERGVQPIIMSTAEEGQFGYSTINRYDRDEKDPLFHIIGFGKKGWTIGDAADNEKKETDSNFSIFVPSKKDNKQKQIVDNSSVEEGPEETPA